MKIQITFRDINPGHDGRSPLIEVTWNNKKMFHDKIDMTIPFEVMEQDDCHQFEALLEIRFLNKTPRDTVVSEETGDIIGDMNFTLQDICINGESLSELLWDGEYVADDGTVYPGCLFFGPPGRYRCKIQMPLLRWRLERNHRINNNDPDWQRDYELYQQACAILARK